MTAQLSIVRKIHKTPYATVEYFRARKPLAANIAKMSRLRKLLTASGLHVLVVCKPFPLDVKCVILPRNIRHFGSQNVSYYHAICRKQGFNMPHIASQAMVCVPPPAIC